MKYVIIYVQIIGGFASRNCIRYYDVTSKGQQVLLSLFVANHNIFAEWKERYI